MIRQEHGWAIPATDATPIAKRLATVWHIDRCMPYVDGRDCVIQAGGNLGQWAAYLSRLFQDVHTFEASRPNYECLRDNLSALPSIHHAHAALGGHRGSARFTDDPDNCEASRVSGDGYEVPMVDIDSLGLSPSLILLDIEGAELEALRGAASTIKQNRPVVLCEVRHGPTEAELQAYLQGIEPGYHMVQAASHDRIWAVRQ